MDMIDLADDDEVITLPELTPRQFAYVQGVLAGKSLVDAYTAAYGTANMQRSTAWVKASELSRHGKIKLWLDAARKAGQIKANLTLDDHLTELDRLKAKAEQDGQFNAAIRAEESRGKAAGLYVEQHRDLTDRTSPKDILKEIAAISPDLAKALAVQHNVHISDEHATVQ